MSNEPMRFLNYYRHCDTQWTDTWSCQCNDECPVCGAEIEPYHSDDIPRDFTVVFYAAGDEEMNEMHEFYCQAVSEEDAEEQCLAANPGCTTTHIEESEED